MTRSARRWIGLVLLLGALLTGAYRIVERNNAAMNPSDGDVPAGFVH